MLEVNAVFEMLYKPAISLINHLNDCYKRLSEANRSARVKKSGLPMT